MVVAYVLCLKSPHLCLLNFSGIEHVENKSFFQFFRQLELITHQAMKAGFTGGLVIDFPNSTKAKK